MLIDEDLRSLHLKMDLRLINILASGTWLIPPVEAAVPHTSGTKPLESGTKPIKVA